MSISDLIRRRAAVERLHPRWADAYPSLEKHGLQGFINDEDPFVRLETGHRLHLAASDSHPDWHLHVTHDSDGTFPARKIVADLGPGDHDVGDRVVRALRHPQVMRGMQALMKPAEPGEWWSHEIAM